MSSHRPSSSVPTTNHDVIVVGGGSAGSLIAGRLAAETDAEVLLLEAGGRDTDPLIHIPAGFAKLLQHGWFLWPYETVPQAQLDGRPRPVQQGKGLGGGSSINAMAYVRGQPEDYEHWAEAAGGTGAWSWQDLLPHFVAMEGNDLLAGPWHGTDGPLKVSQPHLNPLNQAIVKGFQQVGLPYNPDYNGAVQRGVGPCQLTIGDNRRCSAAVAFLHPAKGRPNLTVRTRALATRIILEGDRATGVEYLRNGRPHRALAGEVILSAGALNSPRLLMLSGIGPKDELARHDIRLLVHAPDVGRHLQDHPQVPVTARCRGDWGYARAASGLGMLRAGLQYVLTQTGPAATNGIESVCYFNPDDPDGAPTIQSFHAAAIANAALGKPEPYPGLTLENVVLQPRSRGYVKLRDADPRSAPVFDPNYLGDPEDMRRMVAGLRYVREVLKAPALRHLLEDDPELLPGRTVQSDADLAAHARRTLTCMWHPTGTCRMGADADAVVDPALRVRGVRGLRVVDASIMPRIVSGNTNAPTLALASKGLAMIKDELAGNPPVPIRQRELAA
ncbi:GMC family oxidoreductase N-terminal domain-containing protein [Methylobacterium sp. J-072]|uniref:GMC family oxidoreductase n=1 Tax=Methylobacterium sp. J-072 TaxID=2836651 RepID=UPI001FBAD04E|nr:GMC family oxidoreductase N-terminal domain-containing protein [Methylobacterium sp. J-072]MCJ2094556.1 GMC family oxidoreductase N-terminal domain-containing protein [Methylobacterium sp. J-072]